MEQKARLAGSGDFDLQKQQVALKHVYTFSAHVSDLSGVNVLDMESLACQIKAHLFAKPLVSVLQGSGLWIGGGHIVFASCSSFDCRVLSPLSVLRIALSCSAGYSLESESKHLVC